MSQIIKNIYCVVIAFFVIGVDLHGSMSNVRGVHDDKKMMQKRAPKSGQRQPKWGHSENFVGEIKKEQEPDRVYQLMSAGVLPIIYDKRLSAITAILARRSLTDTINPGKYDYFAHQAHKHDNVDSITVAAQGWHKESRLGEILEWGEEKTRQFIRANVKGYIILATHWKNKTNTYSVMYLVDIGRADIYQKLFEKFETSYRTIIDYKATGDEGWDDFLGKDKLIEVKWNNLLDSVDPKDSKQLISIQSSGEIGNEKIELADMFALLLKGMINRSSRLPGTELKSQFPLGVFIFALQELNEKDFKEAEITLQQKTDLNEEVMHQLQGEEVIEEENKDEQMPAAGLQAVDFSALSSIVQEAQERRDKQKQQKQEEQKDDIPAQAAES